MPHGTCAPHKMLDQYYGRETEPCADSIDVVLQYPRLNADAPNWRTSPTPRCNRAHIAVCFPTPQCKRTQLTVKNPLPQTRTHTSIHVHSWCLRYNQRTLKQAWRLLHDSLATMASMLEEKEELSRLERAMNALWLDLEADRRER